MKRTKEIVDAGGSSLLPPARVSKLYSYVVEHDTGYAPNPYFKVCTLCRCKFKGRKNKGRKNIVELADKGDWVVGTGGANRRKSTGNGTLVYAMLVEDKITREKYFSASRFQGRGDNEQPYNNFEKHDQFVLISRHFYYFGANAIPIPEEFKGERPEGFKLEKKGPGFRSDFNSENIRRFVEWLEIETHERGLGLGRHGDPRQKVADEPKMEGKLCKSSC